MLLPKDIRNNLILLVIATLFALSIAEYVVSKVFIDPVISAAREHGAEFDARSRLPVVLACRKIKDNCYPSVPPNSFLKTPLEVGDNNIIPPDQPGKFEHYWL